MLMATWLLLRLLLLPLLLPIAIMSAAPQYSMADVRACVLNYDAPCGTSLNGLLNATGLAEMVASFNGNIDGCSSYANKIVLDQFKLPSPLPTKTLQLPCTSRYDMSSFEQNAQPRVASRTGVIGSNAMDFVVTSSSASSSVSNSQAYLMIVEKLCRIAWSIDLAAVRMVMLFNFPSKASEPDAQASMPPFTPQKSMPFLHFASKRLAFTADAKYRALTMLHELGHSWGLMHAVSKAGEYGDCSDVMGCADTTDSCFSAANRDRLGWSKAIGPPLNADTQQKNVWVAFSLPDTSSARESYAIVQSPSDQLSLFFSYRSPQPGSAFDQDTPQKRVLQNWRGETITSVGTVSIHAADLQPLPYTYLVHAAVASERWDSAGVTFSVLDKYRYTLAGARLLLHVVSADGRTASIRLCFYSPSPKSCNKEPFVSSTNATSSSTPAFVAPAFTPSMVLYTASGELRSYGAAACVGSSGWQTNRYRPAQ